MVRVELEVNHGDLHEADQGAEPTQHQDNAELPPVASCFMFKVYRVVQIFFLLPCKPDVALNFKPNHRNR